MFSSSRFYSDWLAAQPDAERRRETGWDDLTRLIKEYYRTTENLTLKNFQFRALTQEHSESFPAFCNRVEKEAKHCSFKCTHNDCSAENTAIRDQIVIGTTDGKIREEALMKSWNLQTLRREGMRMESAAKGGAEMSGEAVNKLGKYSYRSMKQNTHTKQPAKRTSLTCYNCGKSVSTPIRKHVREDCEAIGVKCRKCDKIGHLPEVCKSQQARVNRIDPNEQSENLQHMAQANKIHTDDPQQSAYNINILHIKTSKNSVLPKLKSKR